MGRPAPVQTAISNVLKKRRTGLTMDRLQAALPKFDEKSLQTKAEANQPKKVTLPRLKFLDER